MNKDFGNMEELEYGVRLTMPLLTQEEINGINIDIDEITRQFTKMVIKDKDLAIAQYIMDKQQKMLEQKQFILDKVTDKLKEDIKETTLPCVIIGGRRNSKTLEYGKKLGRIETLKEILNIIEGEKNNGRLL